MAESVFELKFGKYCGQGIEDVPTGYLRWLLEQDWFCKQHAKAVKIIESEIKYRQTFGDEIEEDD